MKDDIDDIKDDNEWLKELLKAEDAKRAQNLAKAKEEAKISGKEPFDFDKLYEMVDLSPDLASAGWEPTEEVKESYEYKYYLWCPKIKDLKEYAEYIKMMKLYS